MKKIYILLFMTLCTLSMSAAGEVTPRYLEPAGTFFNPYYMISSSTGKATNTSAYMYMPAAESYLFTSTESGNWTAGSVTATNGNSFDAKFAFGSSSNNIPTLTIADSVYQYGGADNAKNVYVATSSDTYMSPGKLYGNGYSGVTSIVQINIYESYRVFFFNKPGQVMRISEINFPISANKSGKTVDDIFTTETNLTVAIYNATASNRDATGKYSSRSKGTTTLMAPVSLTKDNYIASSTAYRGMVRYILPEPIYITGPFVLEFKGCNTLGSSDLAIYAYHDKCVSTNCVQLYNKNGDKTAYSSATNALTAVKAMFPCVMKADDYENLNFEAEGGEQQLSIFSNVDPAELTITKPDWVDFTIAYESGDAFAANKKSYLNLEIGENDGAERDGAIVIDNHGMKITYSIKQLEKGEVIVPVEEITLNVSEYILEKGYKSTLQATITPDNATDKSVVWSSSDETIVTVDNGEDGTTAGTIHYKKDGTATITATTSNGLTATCVVTTFSYSDFAPFGAATGTWDLIAKSKKLTNLPVMVGQIGANKKRIKVSNFNYSTSDVAKDVIIEWNSETNVCSIKKMSTGYSYNKKTIYMETFEDGGYNPLTGVFTLPMKYYTEDTDISVKTETLTMNHAANMTVGDAKWGTFFAPFDVTLPAGAFAYTITVEDNKTVRNKIAEGGEVVPANTAALIYSATAINEDFEGYATNEEPVGLENALVGTLEPIASGEAPAGAYFLAKKNDVLNFYPAGAAKLAANRAYLVVPVGAKVEGLFDEVVTGINEVNAKNADSILRNIQGLPVCKGYKGIVIENGKKYLKK